MASLVLSQVATSALAPSLYGFMANGASIAASAGLWSAAQAMTGALGALAGSALDRLLFEEKQNYQGPRLGDLTVQTSTEGASLPIVYGTMRIAGNVIWSTGLTEASKKNKTGGGGSGGGGGSYTTYSYSTDCAVAICEGTITGVRRIWADTKLIYDVGSNATFETLQASNKNNIRVYTGSETQLCDPLIQAVEDTDLAYRGTAYVVFEDLQLADYGNRLPNFSFEVVKNGSSTYSHSMWGDPVIQPSLGSSAIIKMSVDTVGSGLPKLTTCTFLGYSSPYYGALISYYFILPDGSLSTRFSFTVYATNTGLLFNRYTNCENYEDDSLVLAGSSQTYFTYITINSGIPTFYILDDGCAPGSQNTTYLYNGIPYITDKYIIIGSQSHNILLFEKSKINISYSATMTAFNGPGYWLYRQVDYPTVLRNYPQKRCVVMWPQFYSSNIINDDYIYGTTWTTFENHIYRISLSTILDYPAVEVPLASTDVQYYNYGRIAGGQDLSRATIGFGFETNSIIFRQGGSAIYKSTTWPIFEHKFTITYPPNYKIGSSDGTFGMKEYGKDNYYFYGMSIYLNTKQSAGIIFSSKKIGTSNPTLKSVADDITARSGLPVSKYNYSSLNATVKGYHIANKMPIKDALEPLTAAYTFDIIEEDSKIVAKPYSSSNTSIRTLTTQEVGTYNYD
jgi:hypothetical protein